MQPIKWFVGCAGNGEDSESLMVLEYSARKHTNREIEFHYMIPSRDPDNFWYCGDGGWQTKLWATPFSGFRWGIPAYCNFEGQAIYSDSDMIVLSDIGNLWDEDFEPGKAVMAKGGGEGWRYCVAKWNCAVAEKYLLPIERMKLLPESHRRMMSTFSQRRDIVQPFSGDWNNVDGEDKSLDNVDMLHYSSMNHQPHLKYAIPRLEAAGQKHWFDGKVVDHWRDDVIKLFDDMYESALKDGYKVEDYIPDVQYGEYNKESQENYWNMHQFVK